MELEVRMSLGYMKGKWWVPDATFEKYRDHPSYKALLNAARKAGIGIECSFSYVAHAYTASVITIERFEKSAQLYQIKHNTATAKNPIAAMSLAVRESDLCTLLLRAVCLELELMLLTEVTSEARKREHREEQMLITAFDLFSEALRIPHE